MSDGAREEKNLLNTTCARAQEPEIKRDTARFARTQWYVDGYASHFFSTEEDARTAWALARQVARNKRNEIGAKMREAIDACT